MPGSGEEPLFDHLHAWDDHGPNQSAAWNMAVDEALLTQIAPALGPVLRCYRWEKPVLTSGYFLSGHEAAAALRPGETLMRRWTGGGLVHHEGTFTWTLAVPRAHPFSKQRPALTYARLHEIIGSVLTPFAGMDIQLVPPATPAGANGLCAEIPAPGDLLLGHRKIAGAGQRRTRDGLLHQGILFLPEATLPPAFPHLLAHALSREVRPFTPAWSAPVPLARYTAPSWNASVRGMIPERGLSENA